MLTKLVPILLLLVNLSVFTNSQGGLSAADPSPDTATTVSTEEMASNKEETGGAGGLVAGTDSETITTPSAPSILLTTPRHSKQKILSDPVCHEEFSLCNDQGAERPDGYQRGAVYLDRHDVTCGNANHYMNGWSLVRCGHQQFRLRRVCCFSHNIYV